MAIYNVGTAVSCLYTSVTNTSGGERYYGFLPPHGRRLANNEQIYVWGDLHDWIQRFATNGRIVESLTTAVDDGDLRIDNTPATIVTDTTNDNIYMVSSTGGTLGGATPCYAA